MSSAELEATRQEMTLLKEEVQHGRLTLENMRVELQDVELQAQQDAEQAAEQIASLQDQLRLEREQREDAETEVLKQKQVFGK